MQQSTNIIFFYGPPATAKSYVAKQVAQNTSYNYICLDDLYKQTKAISDVDKLNKLMQYFQKTPGNFVVDGFLDTKAQSVVLFEHYAKPRYVVYFQSSKDEVEENIRVLSQDAELKKTRTKRFQSFLQSRDELLTYLKKFPFFVTVDAIQKGLSNNFKISSQLIVDSVMKFIKPSVMVALTYNNEELADQYLEKLNQELNYKLLNVEDLCSDESSRDTPLGKQIQAFMSSGQVVPAPMQVELLRKIVYQDPKQNKFILTTFPEKFNEFQVFENNLFPVDALINFMKPGKVPAYTAKINPILKYVQEGKHLVINSEELNKFKAYITKKTRFGLIMGPPQSGKTTLCKHIAQKFGYNLIEWSENTLQALKDKLGTPDAPLDELTLQHVVNYYKGQFENVTNDKFVFDGFPPMCEKPEHIQQFLQLGEFSWFINLQFDLPAQPPQPNKDGTPPPAPPSIQSYWIRYKIKNELDAAQELSPEDQEKLELSVKANGDNLKIIQTFVTEASDSNLFQMDSQYNLETTLKAVEQIFEKRVYLVSVLSNLDNNIKEAMKLVYVNIAAKYNMSFIDVEQLIQQNLDELNNDYEMRWTQEDKQHPSNFSPERITQLIKNYLDRLPSQNRDVLLWGYTSADKKGKKQLEELIFPRAADELIVVEKNLGSIKVLYAVTDQLLNGEIKDPEWVLEKPEVPPPKQEGEGEGDGEGENKDNQDGDEDAKPKFNIYEYQWTKSEEPKNMAQIFMQVKQPNPVNMEVSDYSFKQIYDNFEDLYTAINEDSKAIFFTQIQVQQPIME